MVPTPLRFHCRQRFRIQKFSFPEVGADRNCKGNLVDLDRGNCGIRREIPDIIWSGLRLSSGNDSGNGVSRGSFESLAVGKIRHLLIWIFNLF